MAIICNPACDAGAITRYETGCDAQKEIRKGGISRFILIDCGLDWTDISSASEWATNASDYYVSPEGLGEIQDGDIETEEIGCDVEVQFAETGNVNFILKRFDNESFKDFDLEYDLKNKAQNKTLVLVGCDGLLYFNYNWETGEEIGLGIRGITVNRSSQNGQLQSLNVDFRVALDGSGWRAIKLTDALKNAIFG